MRIKKWPRSVVCVVFLFAASFTGTAQTRQHFDGFSITVTKNGKATAIFFDVGSSVGCSKTITQTGTISRLVWDIIPQQFAVRYKSGSETYHVGEVLAAIPNVSRGYLGTIFRKGNRVKVASRGCGSGLIPELISVRILR